MTDQTSMLVTTLAAIEGRPVQWYLGIVSGDAVVRGEARRWPLPAGDRPGGCQDGGCQLRLREARNTALTAMVSEAAERGANAVLGVDLAYEPLEAGEREVMLMVIASGTAVRV